MSNKITTKVITRAAILTAISIILSRFLSVYLTPNIKIGFASIPLMICGILYGPLIAALSGLAADMIGIAINIGGAFHLGFTISSILTALIPAIVANYIIKDKDKKNTMIILSVVLTFIIVHLLLNSLWLSQLSGIEFIQMMITRSPKVLIELVLNIIIMKIIFDRVIPKV